MDPIAVDDGAILYWSLRCRIRVAATPVAATFDIDVLGTYARRKTLRSYLPELGRIMLIDGKEQERLLGELVLRW